MQVTYVKIRQQKWFFHQTNVKYKIIIGIPIVREKCVYI